MTIQPAFRLLYLILVPIVGFATQDVRVILALFALQIVLWLALRIPFSELSHLRRVRRFALILLLVFSFFHGKADVVLLALGQWSLGFSIAGFSAGLLMMTKLLIMLLAAQIVRSCTSTTEMISGMRALGMSSDAAEIMNSLLDVGTGQQGDGSGQGKHRGGGGNGKGKGHGGETGRIDLKSILKGDMASVYARIEHHRNKIASQFSNSDLASIASSSALIVLVRFIKIAAGLPIAPGHKNVLIVPFFIVGARTSNTAWPGAKIGFYSGVIHFMSGFGKYGPLGVLQFFLLGAVIDGMLSVFRNLNSLAVCGFIGFVAGLFRVSTEIFIAWLLDVPLEFYLFYLPFIAAHCIFGALSAPVTKQLLTRFSDKGFQKNE